MNEFDFNKSPLSEENNQQSRNENSIKSSSNAETSGSDAASDQSTFQSASETAQSPDNTAVPGSGESTSGSYSYRGNQLSDATTRIGQTGTSGANETTSFAGAANFTGTSGRNNGEYEVSFDSASGKYTYTDHTAGRASSEPPRSSKKKRGLLALGLCATILLSALLGAGGGALVAAKLISNSEKNQSNLHQSVQTSTVVQINEAEVNYSGIADAIAKSYDSVVVIETYLSQSYAEAGEASGAGSGVIWTEDGYIVTCNHVIDGANVIRVIFTDGTSYYADVVGTDAQTDLAVLKIQATGLKAVVARGSSLILGETAIAIGNPLGVLANTASEGILSALARDITVEGQTMTLLQTTAAVNSGNSGGGLFDINGSLIGIVNAKSTGTSVEGLGFAIPIETVMEVCTQLIEQGFVNGRPQLGITVVTVTQSNASYIFGSDYYPTLEEYATRTYKDVWGKDHTQIVPGAYIYDATAVAGYANGSDSLKFGDLILYVGNNEIETITDVKSALSGYSAGDTIQLTVLRGQTQTIIINLILGQLGSN